MACKVWRPIFEDDELPDFLSQKHTGLYENIKDPQDSDVIDHARTAESAWHESSHEELEDSIHGSSLMKSSTRIKRELSSSPDISVAQRKKVRMAGGVPPVRKKVYAEGDSDDEIIWDMKQKGYRDQPICDYLIANERTRYDVKTIATRYARIKKAKAAAMEKRLESDFEDYDEADDLALRAALDETNFQREKEIAEAEDRHWTAIAEAMNAKLPAPKFTKKLAKERWDSLQAGTAPVPLEKDPDPEGRIARVRKQKAERRHIMEQEQLHEMHEEEIKDAEAEKAAQAKADAKEKVKMKRAAKKAAADAKKARNKAKAEAAAEARRNSIAAKADAKVQQVLDRQRRKQELADKKAAAAWQKKLQMAELRQKKQEKKLLEAQRVADAKAAEIREEIENTKRKELIRRHMRLAGAQIAAPLTEAPTVTAKKTGSGIASLQASSSKRDLSELEPDEDDESEPTETTSSKVKSGRQLTAKDKSANKAKSTVKPKHKNRKASDTAKKRIKLTYNTDGASD